LEAEKKAAETKKMNTAVKPVTPPPSTTNTSAHQQAKAAAAAAKAEAERKLEAERKAKEAAQKLVAEREKAAAASKKAPPKSDDDTPSIEDIANKAIADAQRKVEAHHFDMRKNLLDYDDVMNQQREVVYDLRLFALEGFGEFGERVMSFVMLTTIDDKWKDHLYDLDHLKTSISFRSWGQKDPLVEYKKESFRRFESMMDRIEDETVRYLYFLRFEQSAPTLPFVLDDEGMVDDEATEEMRELEQSKAAEEEQRRQAQSAVQDMTRNIQRQHEKELKELQFLGTSSTVSAQPISNGGPKVGRNDPCPCGSGKKYKKCHGVNA